MLMYGFRKKLFYKQVVWKFPQGQWFKCNTDGASKDNSGVAFYEFYFRDKNGDVINTEAGSIGFTTNIVANITTILKALQYEREV